MEEAREVFQRVKRVTRSANIAGGYARDVVFGKNASDIDIWIPVRYYPTPEARESVVNRIGEALDQYGFQMPARASYYRPSNTDRVNNMTRIRHVYEPSQAFFNRGGFNPIQVIFCDQPDTSSIHTAFHVGLSKCKFNSQGEAIASIRAHRDFQEGILTLTNGAVFEPPRRLAGYLNKLKRKYEGFSVRLPFGSQWIQLYQHLLNEGVLDAPRAMVQAETQGTQGNQVRFEDGAGFVQSNGSFIPDRNIISTPAPDWATRNQEQVAQWIAEENQRIRDQQLVLNAMGVQATTNTVRDEARVQPGLPRGITEWGLTPR